MKTATIAALIAFIEERMGEYPSNYTLQSAGSALIAALELETPTD
jgi:hypothetical protein